MTTPVNDIDWLTRSENRVAVLEALAEKRRERSELQDLTGVSRVTSNRTLAELEDRDWIQRDGHQYDITPTGRLVTEDLKQLFDTTALGQKLGDIQQYLPVDEFDFDLRRLQDAKITRPTESDTVAPLSRSADLLSESTQRFVPLVANIDRLHTREVGQLDTVEHVEAIITADVMETILADSMMQEDITEFIKSEFDLYLYEGSASITFNLFDNTVAFELNDGSGFVPALIEVDDQVVLEWAEETYDQYKRDAEPLEIDDFEA
jgi:predicted transcriptional regulator